ncbi:MAG: sensor histidine kinase N-terminal domain-containing protein [Phycisphaerae bacterium]|nr:sensor histidine kinase N-terminal domain-containing protein [Phycisphaerae bacterium]
MKTIRGRLLATLIGGLAVTLSVGGAAVYWIEEASLTRAFDARLESRARSLATLVAHERGRLKFDGGDAALVLADAYFEVRTLDGALRKRSDNLEDFALPAGPLDADAVAFADVDLPDNAAGRVVWMRFDPAIEDEDEDDAEPPAEGDEEEDEYLAHGPVETLIATAALDREPIDGALGTLLSALLIVGGVVAITVAGLVTIGVRWGLRPLDRLRHQLSSVSGQTISRRFDDGDTPAELAPVYVELNHMLDRVERTLERERSFADAAAHELRTPLAELRSTAEVAVRWPDSAEAATALDEVLAIGSEMERLVESLLLISRGHATAGNGSGDRHPTASIVRSCLARSAKPINDKRLQLTVEVDEAGTLPAPSDAVEIIVRNLIDNAVRYTPSEGRITIRGERGGNGVADLVVENGPAGLVEHDLPRLFEPFWRREESRADRTHVGLGLSVVQQIAHAIGLRVEAALSGDQLRMRITCGG